MKLRDVGFSSVIKWTDPNEVVPSSSRYTLVKKDKNGIYTRFEYLSLHISYGSGTMLFYDKTVEEKRQSEFDRLSEEEKKARVARLFGG
jgi:hypothetical protein